MSGATVLLEARPFRPFKSSEEYLYAMKEDLAEWLNTLYPELGIHVDNFMDRIDTGVVLCKHANNVKKAAAEYVSRRQARSRVLTRSMTKSITTNLAVPVSMMPDVHYLPAAKPGTFFARDNVSNFILWCRKSLGIFECLLFETDDLILRKNEKHVILCLLEVARKGAKFGMLAPMLVQMERQIDREIALEQRAAVGNTELCSSDSEDETDQPPVIMVYGPQPQIVTNDLKSLDEMVRDLVEKCSCPTQFPMIRVSEGKYRIGDTKVLIFVRILRNHVMVRVGGGWDTLSHYLDKHDPCRCRAQHRTALASRVVNKPGAQDLSGALVQYDRSPPRTRRSSVSSVCSNVGPAQQNPHLLTPTMSSKNRSRSPTPSRKLSHQLSPNHGLRSSASPNPRSPTPSRKLSHQLSPNHHNNRRSASPNPVRKSPNTSRKNLGVPSNSSRRSRSPTPSLAEKHVASLKITPETGETGETHISEASLQIFDNGTTVENSSDNGSEISDEGYRSLGLINNTTVPTNDTSTTKTNNKVNRLSLNSQNSIEDAEFGDRNSQHNSDSGSNNGDAIKTIEDTSATITNVADDVYNESGLRKTFFSDAFYNDKKPEFVPKPRGRSFDNTVDLESRSRSNSHDRVDGNLKRNSLTYRSVRERKPNSLTSSPIKTIKSATKPSGMKLSESFDKSGTWNGRQTKQRPSLLADTFTAPTAKNTSNFGRNTIGRSSMFAGRTLYDSNGRRIKTNSASANTSPTKQKSPLLEQILKTAEEAKDDAQMIEKIKNVIKKYTRVDGDDTADMDFTSAWVHSQGGNETKRSSLASDGTSDSAGSKGGNIGALYVPPRKDTKPVGHVSKIPAPVSYVKRTTPADVF